MTTYTCDYCEATCNELQKGSWFDCRKRNGHTQLHFCSPMCIRDYFGSYTREKERGMQSVMGSRERP